MTTTLLRLPVLAVLAALLAGCAVSGLAFRVDDRVEITHPEDRASVTLPVTITWTVDGFDVAGPDAGRFGVFVDRAPQPPGEGLDWFARDDDSCRPEDGCPDAEYFRQRQIHATSDTSFVIDALPPPSTSRGPERHEVTIVLLDGDDRRIGESAFHVEFEVDREDEDTS